MKILLQKNPVMAGVSGKIRPDSMKKSGKSGSGRTLKMLIWYTPNLVTEQTPFLEENFQIIFHSLAVNKQGGGEVRKNLKNY